MYIFLRFFAFHYKMVFLFRIFYFFFFFWVSYHSFSILYVFLKYPFLGSYFSGIFLFEYLCFSQFLFRVFAAHFFSVCPLSNDSKFLFWITFSHFLMWVYHFSDLLSGCAFWVSFSRPSFFPFRDFPKYIFECIRRRGREGIWTLVMHESEGFPRRRPGKTTKIIE